MSARVRRARELAAYEHAAEVGCRARAARTAEEPTVDLDASHVLGAVLARARRHGDTATITVPTAVLDEWLARHRRVGRRRARRLLLADLRERMRDGRTWAA